MSISTYGLHDACGRLTGPDQPSLFKNQLLKSLEIRPALTCPPMRRKSQSCLELSDLIIEMSQFEPSDQRIYCDSWASV